MLTLNNYLKNEKVQKVLSKKPGEEGFSLVELVIVIAVLAILAAVPIPAFKVFKLELKHQLLKMVLLMVLKNALLVQLWILEQVLMYLRHIREITLHTV